MFLGLSGSAALGAALYAPDLAVAVRRAVRAPRRNGGEGGRCPIVNIINI